jgi:hypothetical protein
MKSIIVCDITPCGVSEEHIASIFRVEEISSARNQPASTWQAEGDGDEMLLHGVISQKMIFFITTAVKTSNLTISGNACYHSVQNLLSSHLLSKNVKIQL